MVAVMTERPANDDRIAAARIQISDHDLSAYVAGGLSPARRTEVEGFLACNPDVAARVMTELHRRGRAGAAAPRRRTPWGRVAAGLAVTLVAGGLGWTVAQDPDVGERIGDVLSGAPAYVEDAFESRQATEVRAAMVSQAETPTLDRAEIQRTMKLRAPNLPAGWRLIDAQVYPSDDGPGLSIVAEAPSGRRVNLFAVRANTWVTAKPVLARRGRDTVAFWESGGSAFVLIGDNAGGQLLAEANILARET